MGDNIINFLPVLFFNFLSITFNWNQDLEKAGDNDCTIDVSQ